MISSTLMQQPNSCGSNGNDFSASERHNAPDGFSSLLAAADVDLQDSAQRYQLTILHDQPHCRSKLQLSVRKNSQPAAHIAGRLHAIEHLTALVQDALSQLRQSQSSAWRALINHALRQGFSQSAQQQQLAAQYQQAKTTQLQQLSSLQQRAKSPLIHQDILVPLEDFELHFCQRPLTTDGDECALSLSLNSRQHEQQRSQQQSFSVYGVSMESGQAIKHNASQTLATATDPQHQPDASPSLDTTLWHSQILSGPSACSDQRNKRLTEARTISLRPLLMLKDGVRVEQILQHSLIKPLSHALQRARPLAGC